MSALEIDALDRPVSDKHMSIAYIYMSISISYLSARMRGIVLVQLKGKHFDHSLELLKGRLLGISMALC